MDVGKGSEGGGRNRKNRLFSRTPGAGQRAAIGNISFSRFLASRLAAPFQLDHIMRSSKPSCSNRMTGVACTDVNMSLETFGSFNNCSLRSAGLAD